MENQMTVANNVQVTGQIRIYKSSGDDEKRKVYDNIHGFIYFKKIIWDFIDTPHFQRLRKIKQLGCLQYVFPGATNTRFEHSIGTAHLAKKFIGALIQNNASLYSQQQKIDAQLTVTLAGLLHDIGHGPYSHTFDSHIVTKIDVKNKEGNKQTVDWSHEIASVALFDDLMKNQLKGRLTDRQIRRIKLLIIGQLPKDQDQKYRLWQYQLISNKQNGIDIDKLDYFRRDAFYLGAKNIFVDHDLLMNQAKIINNQICYPTKYDEIVYSIFHCRYKLYKTFYFNVVSKGIEQMICDVLFKTKDTFKFKQACQSIFDNPSNYIKLTDNILQKIEDIYDSMVQRNQPSEQAQKKKFQQAKLILHRLKTRKLYKFVKQYHYYIKDNHDPQLLETFKIHFQKQVLLQNISKRAKIDPQLLSISICSIGFGFKQKNPLKTIGFFRKEDKYPKRLKPQETESLSMLFTNTYLEKSIKLFIKVDDINKHNAVEKAFTQYCKDVNSKCKSVFKEIGVNNFIIQGRSGTPSKVLQQNQISIASSVIRPLDEIRMLNDDDYE